jgi:hypothetical protein
MSSEDTYKGDSKSIQSQVVSQFKTVLSDLTQSKQSLPLLDKDTPPPLREAKYTAKGAIRRLERMFAAGEDEI